MDMLNTTIWWPQFCGNSNIQEAFWSVSLSVDTPNPDVTTCFRETVLTWLPAAWLTIATPFYIASLCARDDVNSWWKWSVLNLIKVMVSLVMFLSSLFALVPVLEYDIMNIYVTPPSTYTAVIVEILTLSWVTFLLRWEFVKGVHSGGVMLIFWSLSVVCDIFNLRSTAIRVSVYGFPADVRVVLTYIHIIGSVLSFILQLFADRKALGPQHFANRTAKDDVREDVPLLDLNAFKPQVLKMKPSVPQSPELHAPWWQLITHWWITRELLFGLGKNVTFHDLYDIRPWDKAAHLVSIFKRHLYRKWGGPDRPKDCFSQPVPYPLSWCLTMTVGKPLLIGIALRICSISLDLTNAQLLRVLVDYISMDDPYTWKGIFLASAMFVVSFASSLLLHNFYNQFWVTGMRVRSILNSLVYEKALRLSWKAKRSSTLGEVINIMSVDGQKLQDVFFTASHIWEIPLDVTLCMLALNGTVGISSLAGLAVIVVLVPVVGVVLSYRIRKLQVQQMQVKDSRIKYLSEVLQSIKIIKLYGWEPPFVTRIHDTREKELQLVTAANVTSAISSMFSTLCPYLMSLAIYTTYIMLGHGHYMTPDKAFGTLAVINILYYPISRIPTSLFAIAQAYVSIKRTNRFLNLEESEDMMTSSDALQPGTIKAKYASFSWDTASPPTLKSINLKIPPGALVGVVGKVGSGKSSLISGLLGEMTIPAGKVKLGGRIGYVPQEPWIFNATLRENILFGKPMRDVDYRKTLSACALQRDLRLLDGGDQCEIGEKGDNLSGGQRARVSLARAVYADADIYFLDDPLSAVDAHVGKHIFDHVIGPQGALKTKTRLFVTHALTYLSSVDQIILLADGEVAEIGTFNELMDQEGEFYNMYNSAMSAKEDDVDSISHKEGEESQQGKTDKAPTKLMQQETANKGSVSKHVVWDYIKAGGLLPFFLMVTGMALYVASQVGTNIWLSDWSSDREEELSGLKSSLKFSVHWRLAIYGLLGFTQGLTLAMVLFSIALGCVAAARVLHGEILSRVVRAPMSFFDTTPVGRIINRFSKDMDILDTNMYIYIAIWLFCLAPIASALVAISYTVPVLIVLFIFVAILYAVVQRTYMNYFRQLRRIDSVRRSPLYTHFLESLVGTSSIKAYRKQQDFKDQCYQLVDESQRAWYLIIVTRRWMGVTMDTVGCFILFFTALFVTLRRDQVGAGLSGMAVSYALQVISLQNKLIRFATELETYLTSIERIYDYTKIVQEKAWKDLSLSPPDIWPYTGAIEFLNYSTRYREGLDYVLKGLDIEINPGEKIGVVGRTGAGKSSLLLALFRIIEPSEGTIVVDGLKITCLGLHDVRSRFAIIPQEPAIFTGTLRMNLDPYNQYKDHDLWKALEAVRLAENVKEWGSGLCLEIGETGHNLSLGQRQLVCLARVLLRQPKVLVLDEATAAVDLETDEFIQKTIKSQFPDCTVITIAHRLSTVLDYDRIMVMDSGRVSEFDTPESLMHDINSRFHSMARQAGLLAGSSATTPDRETVPALLDLENGEEEGEGGVQEDKKQL